MKTPQNSQNTNHNKASINLPEQKTWKELEGNQVKSSLENTAKLDSKTAKKIGCLLDKAFNLLLEKLIRQS